MTDEDRALLERCISKALGREVNAPDLVQALPDPGDALRMIRADEEAGCVYVRNATSIRLAGIDDMPQARGDDVISIRLSAEMRALLNRAAALRGQKLSEFVLESARRQAEEAVLDQRAFFLDPQMHEQFLAMLDCPAKPSRELRALMRCKPASED